MSPNDPQRTASSEVAGVPGIVGLDHIAIAVPAAEISRYVQLMGMLGLHELHRETVPDQKVDEVLYLIGDGPSKIQLLSATSDDSPIAAQLARNGGRAGLAHIAFLVDDAEQAFQAMGDAGFRLVDDGVRKGSRGTRIFFVHPKSHELASLGVLLEMVEEPRL